MRVRDLNGNRTQKTETAGGTTYTYDDENRLARVETTGINPRVITYAYDPFGRRTEKNVNGTMTRYLYDREDILLEYDQAGTVTARYIHGPGIDEPLAMEKNSQMYYYHADGLGSIIALTDSTGAVVQAYQYEAFGNITSGTPTVAQPYAYTAREYDAETGLYFYRARHYDSTIGRFSTRDPIGFKGGINQYVYVNNNPVKWTDPTGLDYGSNCRTKCGINCADKATQCFSGALGYGLPTCATVCYLLGGKWVCPVACGSYSLGTGVNCYLSYLQCINDCADACICRDPM